VKDLTQMAPKPLSADEVKGQVEKAQQLVRETKRTLARLQEKTGVVLIRDPSPRRVAG
jgi:hypothetical protein